MQETVTRLLDGEGEKTATERRVERASCWLGLVAPVVTLGGIFLAAGLSPAFEWGVNALSDLGRADVAATQAGVLADPRPSGVSAAAATPTTKLVFNSALLLGAALGLGFGAALLRTARNRLEFAGVGLFGVALVLMGLVGVFPWPYRLHVPVAAGFYTFLCVALMVYGAGNVVAGDRVRGGATWLAGAANGLLWLGWLMTGGVLAGPLTLQSVVEALVRPGLAYPEILGALTLAVWAVGTAVVVRRQLGHGSFSPV
ncbi:MAG: DUF998 domain-containing protein [Halorientalis sp.]